MARGVKKKRENHACKKTQKTKDARRKRNEGIHNLWPDTVAPQRYFVRYTRGSPHAHISCCVAECRITPCGVVYASGCER